MTVWDAMIGQPEAVETLKRAAQEGRSIAKSKRTNADTQYDSNTTTSPSVTKGALSHAWLITGPPGSGRSTAATCFAAALQCVGEPIGCGTCSGCHTVLQGSHPDVQQYATDLRIIPIGSAREWVERSYQVPSYGKWRVTIVEDADRIEDRSAGALLKAVEEPPERGIWVLCAPTSNQVISTIRSRCRQINLRTPTAQNVAKYLAKMEGFPFEEAEKAAVIAQSHVGLARAMLRDPKLREKRVELLTMLLDPKTVGEAVVAAGSLHDAAKQEAKTVTETKNRKEKEELARALGVEKGKRIPPALRTQMKLLEEEQERRTRRSLHDVLDRVLTDMLGFYRDVLTVQLGGEVTFVNVDLEEKIRQTARGFTAEEIWVRTESLNRARLNLQTNAAPLLILESTALTIATGL